MEILIVQHPRKEDILKRLDNKTTHGTAALYCRLSRDDNMDSESNSIQNQKASCKGSQKTIIFQIRVSMWTTVFQAVTSKDPHFSR